MRYSLRTLLIVVTAVCVVLGYVAYRLGRDRDRGYFLTGNNVLFRGAEVPTLAKTVRERTRNLPGHKTGKPMVMPTRIYAPGREVTADAERFSYEVTLSDGSKTQVGFWVYPRHRGPGVIVLIQAKDPVESEARRQERLKLLDTYNRILINIALEILEQTETRE